MVDEGDRLRWVLEQEVALHRELVRLARLRHLLLRQERYAEAAELAVAEAACIVAVRDLERQRCRLPAGGTDAVQARLRQEIATLVRRLAAVERASQAAWVGQWIPSPGEPTARAKLN